MKRALQLAGHAAIGSIFGDGTAERLAFYHFHGYLPDLRSPKTFNEKIAWRKLNDRDPWLKLYADKARAKEMVAPMIGADQVIPRLAVFIRTDNICLDFPMPFVIKATHGSGLNIFVRCEADKEGITAVLRAFLATNYAARANEWAYGFRPRLLVEPLIERATDFKFHVFGGKVFLVQVDVDRFTDHRRSFYTPEWMETDCALIYPRAAPISRPAPLAGMIDAAERIGAQFSYARIDLYDGPLFGEVTFYPEAGRGRFSSPEWDLRFGEQWNHSVIPRPASAARSELIAVRASASIVAPPVGAAIEA